MSALDARDVSRFLFNPFAIFVADVGDAQPANPSFYTDPGITVTPNADFVPAEAYNNCSGVLYTVRQDLQRFNLRVGFSIKELVPDTYQLVYGGTADTAGTTITMDGVAPSYKAFWIESCFSDDSKVVRITIPKGKSVEFAEMTTGDTHLMVPAVIEALPEIDDATTLPTIYFES